MNLSLYLKAQKSILRLLTHISIWAFRMVKGFIDEEIQQYKKYWI
jgi:hypothetical protein